MNLHIATTPQVKPPRPPRATTELLAACAAHMTPRDRHVIEYVHEHDVLTTNQLTQLVFGNPRIARRRLLLLHQLGLLTRFRPWAPVGSHPWHWILGPTGARILSDDHDTTETRLGYRPGRAIALATSPRLAHTIGRNNILTTLAAHARHHDDRQLLTWRGERSCASEWGDIVRPDAHVTWHEASRTIDFFLEYDAGTERPITRLTSKLDAYTDLAETLAQPVTVLFHLPHPRREDHLHQAIADQPPRLGLLVATTTARLTEHHPDGPAGPIWKPTGRAASARVRLADLTNQEPDAARAPAT